MKLGPRLLLGTGGLLLLVTAALSAAAYFEVRRTAIRTATERVRTVAAQIAILIQNSGSQFSTAADAAAHRRRIEAFLARPDSGGAGATRAALLDVGQPTGTFIAMELRDTSGRALVWTYPDTGWQHPLHEIDIPRPAVESEAIGPLRRLHGVVVYPTVAAVGTDRTLGYVVHWRRFRQTPGQSRLVADLISPSAGLYVGNVDGRFWVDLGGGDPPFVTTTLGAVDSLTVFEDVDGARGYLAAAAPVRGSPWVTMVTLPWPFVLAPVDRFLERMLLIAIVSGLVGLASAWVFSRRIAGPVQAVSAAADGIAAGDYSRRVELDRDDELGQLARSFSAMAAEVEESRLRLEARVRERTRELDHALRELATAQDALVRREKLATLGQLAGSLGHELRNPLGVMSNAVYYLESVLATAPPNVREYLGILRTQIALSVKLVSDLLEFSRVRPASRQPVALADVVGAQLDRVPIATPVEIERDFPDELPLVHADPVQIGQVVFNLVTNALQAMGDEGGRLALRAVSDGNGTVVLEVQDSGPGVAATDQELIFEPLYTTKARGIGLGLAVSRSLARANGGDLTVESRPGEGARFRVTLPTASAEAHV